MPTIPGELLPWISCQFFDDDGNPLAGGSLQFYETGTTTPKDTYADAQLTTPNPNPMVLDGTGRATIFLGPDGYDVIVSGPDDVVLYTVVNVENVGTTFFSQLGYTLGQGAVDQESGYEVLTTDNFVSMASTGGDDPCVVALPLAADYLGGPLTIKNKGDIELAITPAGSDTIDYETGPYTVPAAATPNYPSIVLLSDGDGGWYIQASHGLTA